MNARAHRTACALLVLAGLPARGANLLPCKLDCTVDVPAECRYVKSAYVTAIASVPKTGDEVFDFEEAEKAANSRLLDSLSGRPGVDADALRPKVVPLLHGESPDGARRCATVGLQKDELELSAKVAAEIAAFDQGVAKSIASLGKRKGSLLRRGRSIRVAVGKVTVDGTPGGPNGQWVALHLIHGLQTAPQFRLVNMPEGWAGGELPPGIDGLWTADAFAHSAFDRDTAEVDLQLNLRDPSHPRETLLEDALTETIPSDVFPLHPIGVRRESGTSVLDCGGFCVAIDTPNPGGALCPGQTSQVYLTSDEDARALVFDVFGRDQALLIFPNDQQPQGALQAGAKLSLYPGGFQPVPYPGGPDERIVAFRAPSAKAFGKLARWKGTCRVPPALARKLHEAPRSALRGGTLRNAEDAYQILPASNESCAGTTAPAAGDLEQALAALPLCGS